MTKTPPKKRRGRPRLAKGKGVLPTLAFRPEVEVRASVERAAAATGNTLSAEINAGLRRVYWKEKTYAESQVRNFGSDYGQALAFLLARVLTGIEHEMRSSVRDSEAVRIQVDQAYRFIIDAVLARWRGNGGPILLRDTPFPPMRIDNLGATELCEALQSDSEEQPWHRVIDAIHTNLTTGHDELWWPLADRPAGGKPLRSTEPLLRPKIEVLREVWPVGAIAN